MNCKNSAGFTLVETLIALMIDILVIILLANFYSDRQTEAHSLRFSDQFQVATALATLQGDQLSLEYAGENQKQLLLYSPTKKMEYTLKITDHKLVMQGKNQGYMPLLYDLQEGKLTYHAPYLDLKFSLHDVVFHEKICFRTKVKKGDRNEE
ncbi:hypothetical protein LFYK43_11230 [Ligilactobacillus salitolerans]|uniref:Competence protein ComGD n=1 Tax=Ligilactobacillus salitolerans TaxID=1808352 RepID=A0A401IT17_9LACO|nr:prepilin-type N-terminal cleavage/methylation domain-containing protein [Ligilactobacillus salitolerans]GBG94664.1 hypothetical protein LFYK43_11230 [Ligilactobacillus salitolerans]